MKCSSADVRAKQFDGTESNLITLTYFGYIDSYKVTETVHLKGITNYYLVKLTKDSVGMIISKGNWVVIDHGKHLLLTNREFKSKYGHLWPDLDTDNTVCSNIKLADKNSTTIGYIIKVGNQYISEKNYFKDNYEISWGVKLSNNQRDALVFNNYDEAEKYAQFCKGKVGTVSLENT